MSDQIIKYKNYFPTVKKNNSISGKAWLIGNVRLMDNVTISEATVIRGDGQEIVVGRGTIVKNNCTIHVASDVLGTTIKSNCLIGSNTVIHSCILKNNVIVGNNCVIMDGAELGNNSIVSNDSLIAPGKKIPKFSLVKGTPGKIIKILNKDTFIKYRKRILMTHKIKRNYLKNSIYKNLDINNKKVSKNVYIAPDLFSSVELFLEDNVSIWFSVKILGVKDKGKLIIGKGTNIQDNSVINTKDKQVIIGNKVTIGHNVSILGPVKIEDNAVIGMGSIIEEGTVVRKNGFVGANSFIPKNTLIPEDTIFAGSPATLFRKVKNSEKEYFSIGQKVYEKLAIEYRK